MNPTFPWFLTWLCLIYIGIGLAYNASKCVKGEYKSDFLSGGCVKCPERLKDCENEEIDDARRCFIACGQETSTKQPFLSSTAAPQVKISVTVITDTTSTKNSSKIKKTISTQQVPDNSSSRTDYDRFMLSTLSYEPNEQTGNSNGTVILVGVLFSLAALFCVVIGCFLFLSWRRRRENTTEVQEPRCTYNPVFQRPISNSEQNTSDALLSNTDDVAITMVTMGPEPSSLRLSSEEFERLTPGTES